MEVIAMRWLLCGIVPMPGFLPLACHVGCWRHYG